MSIDTSEPLIDSQAGVLARSTDVNADVAFYRSLGFRVEEIFPADAPHRAVVSGFGVRLFLEPDAPELSLLRIRTEALPANDVDLRAPGGTRIEVAPLTQPVHIPPLESELIVSRLDPDDEPHAGRAGMRYRDLVPGRQGGSVIASMISIASAGPVNDWVHYHEIRFQLIFVKSGWVRVVYEDQGDSFVMHAGDCVIQPPMIRHRVLENSDGLEVVEVGYPAEHITKADPLMVLPNTSAPSARKWEGQSFIRHIDSQASWVEVSDGLLRTATGVSEATSSLAHVDVTRAVITGSWSETPVSLGEFVLLVVLEGIVKVDVDATGFDLGAGESIVVPVASAYAVHHQKGSRVLRVRIDTIN